MITVDVRSIATHALGLDSETLGETKKLPLIRKRILSLTATPHRTELPVFYFSVVRLIFTVAIRAGADQILKPADGIRVEDGGRFVIVIPRV